jgi:CheY-like chemotaxis protein
VGTAGTPKRKVLVVDDDPSWRHLLALELEELGYEPVLAADGAEALGCSSTWTARSSSSTCGCPGWTATR